MIKVLLKVGPIFCFPFVALSLDCLISARRLLAPVLNPVPKFSYQKFLEQQQLWQEKATPLLAVDAPEIASPESFLAYVEVSIRAQGLSRLRLQQLLSRGPTRQQKKLLKSLGAFKGKPQRSNLRSFINDLYLLVYVPEKPFWQRFFSIQDLIQVRIESEILHSQLEQALINLGILPSEGTIYQQFVQWKNRHVNLIDAASYLSLNAIKLTAMGTMGGVPQTHLLQSVEQTAEVGTLIREQGFDRAYPQLLASFGKEAIIDRVVLDARISYNLYFVLLLAIFFYDNFPQLHFFFNTVFISSEDLHNYQAMVFDGERIRQEQLAGFIAGNIHFFNISPTEEQRWQQWELLRSISDQQLKRGM